MTTPEIERLRKVRGGHRAVITRVVREVDDTLSTDGRLGAEQLQQLSVKLQQLDGKLKVLSDIDKEILDKCDVDTIEREIDESETVTARILECKQRISEVIKGTTTTTSGVPAVTGHGITATYNKPKLPKLTLPRFKGDLTAWTTFWDLFKSSVHENNGVPKIDKFSYLKSLLEGPAARAIQGLTLSEANYDSAIGILQERFGKPQAIITAHMEELLKVSNCTNDRSSSLRSVYDRIIVQVRGLESLDVTSDQYGSLLVPVILSKFPSDIRLRVARESTGDTWNITQLLGIIKREVEAREASESTHVSTPRLPNPTGRGPSGPNSTASALLAGGSNIRCVYCNENHFSASCTKVVSQSDRKEHLKKSGRCFNCLRRSHKSRNCDSERTCRYCHNRHHQSLCNQCPTVKKDAPVQNNSDEPQNATVNTSSQMEGKQVVLLQTAQVEAVGGNATVPVRLLLDNGSQLSYVTTSLKSKLKLKPVRQERLSLNTFGSDSFTIRGCDVVKLMLQRPGFNERLEILAHTAPVICSNLPTLVDVNKYTHLQGLELADKGSLHQPQIDVLIGSNYYWKVVTGDIVNGDCGPVAVSSIFGWLLSGPVSRSSSEDTSHSLVVIGKGQCMLKGSQNDCLVQTLKHFWDNESIGILDVPEGEHSTQFLPEIQFNGTRYEVRLPWKEDYPSNDIPNHFHLCFNRLKYLQQRLLKIPDVLHGYHDIIREQLDQGIIEAVVDSNDITSGHIHYLPHHAVVRQDKETTKIRVVYDGSARSGESPLSINDCLLTGPNLIPKLFNILIRFRWNAIAITADIEKAFLMIAINRSDRDMLRFLWFEQPDDVNSEVSHFRFNRLVFGLRPSPAILGFVISHHLSKYREQYPTLVQSIVESLYVDDLIAGADSVEQGFHLYQKSKEIMTAASFNLRKWNSNSPELLGRIKEAELQGLKKNLSPVVNETTPEASTHNTTIELGKACTESEVSKLLGITWNGQSDKFLFCFSELIEYAQGLSVTRRSLLKVSARIFDPLGLISPFVVKLKILFQTLCAESVAWDEPLQGGALDQWNCFMSEARALHQLSVPRCYFLLNSIPSRVQLHGFSDASEQAFAAAIYLRSVYPDGTITTRLVAAKTRVAPMKKQSIPRLELLGALILARLTNTIVTALNRDIDPVYWVDSMTALFWIRREGQWKQYVANRVKEIRRLSSKNRWRHCPGNLNPADLPSRGVAGDRLLNNTLWWEGPPFLLLPEDEWPREVESHVSGDAATQELIKNPPEFTHVVAVHTKSVPNLEAVIDCKRYSSLTCLLRVTSYVFRMVKACRQLNAGNPDNQLRPEDLQHAEVSWIRHIQATSFVRELAYLWNSGKPPTPIYVQQFGLYLDDKGVMKCKGRINNSTLSLTEKNPVLLPAKHPFTKLLVMRAHQQVKHGGVNATLTTLRERYWVLKGRQIVKGILRSCVVCKKLEGLPYASPLPPDLPACRVSDDPPFAHTGVDFAGPLYVQELVDREHNTKVYICLFTCASTRAIHLELTRGLNVDSFIMAFRRFVGRRGLPATLLSDNAKTFKSSSKDVQSICRSSEVLRYLTNQRTSWKFIVPKAPWWGGFWERMVQTVKRSLRKVVGRAVLKFDELNTLLIEIESVINGRPLTYVYDDSEGTSYALTPAHLLYGHRLVTSPSETHFEIVSTNKALTRRAKNQRFLLNQFATCWRKDYLLSLRESKVTRLKSQASCVKVGDIVILKDENVKRVFWKLAKIVELLKGKDDVARAALINVATDNGPPKILRRSIKQLIPIEVASIEDTSESIGNIVDISKSVNADDQPTHSTRPRRAAAIVGEAIRRNWTGL